MIEPELQRSDLAKFIKDPRTIRAFEQMAARTGVEAGGYGDGSHLVRFTVDGNGRVTGAEQIDLNSDGITEGAKLFFTDARARAALSGDSGVSYDSGTGVISATPAGAAPSFAPYTSPVISNPPTQAEVQAISDAVASMSLALGSLISLMQGNGNLT